MTATEKLLQSEGHPGVNVTQVWPVVWAIKQAVQVICILLGGRVSCPAFPLGKGMGVLVETGSPGTALFSRLSGNSSRQN